MEHSPDTTRAALLLTNRLVPLDASPMTAREFWALVERVDPAGLLHADVATIVERAGVDADEAARLRTLLDASTALSFEQERLHDGGVTLLCALDAAFPTALRDRLGAGCPPFLLTAGPIDWLSVLGLGVVGLGVVGLGDAPEPLLAVARQAAELAVQHDWPVVTGLADGVDHAARTGSIEAGGTTIGVAAEGISIASRSTHVRRRVHAAELCIASPFAPNAPFRAANAIGCNRIVHALSRATFVVAADEATGGAWSAAMEALERRYAPVAVWVGDGATAGNHALVSRGATPITDLATLFDIGTIEPPPSPRP